MSSSDGLSTSQSSSSIDSSQSIRVTLKKDITDTGDGVDLVFDYTMRGLTEEEIPKWTEFCASVFAYKSNPPPPSYFARHYYNDPLRDARLVRVVLYNDQIVSSCRIFAKQISRGRPTRHPENPISEEDDNTSSVWAGGIGEVCTLESHRRRGLSKLLLRDALRIMKTQHPQQPFEVSLLHAGPDFFPVYQRGGNYQSTLSEWSTCRILPATLVSEAKTVPATTRIRLARFPQDAPRLGELHRAFSEHRFAGCIIRSQEYWNQYLSKELNGTLCCLVDQKKQDGRENNNSDEILAWISVRPRGQRKFQLREFGCDLTQTTVLQTFPALLDRAMQDVLEKDDTDGTNIYNNNNNAFTLHLPTFLLRDLMKDDSSCAFIDASSVQVANDEGWMYVTLKEGGINMVELNRTTPHLIWPADSF